MGHTVVRKVIGIKTRRPMTTVNILLFFDNQKAGRNRIISREVFGYRKKVKY
jgi:hypothetical protein